MIHLHLNNWKWHSMSAAVCFSPDRTDAALVFAMQPDSYNDESIMDFLLDHYRHLDGDKVTLIWDGLPSHRSRAMQKFIKSQRSSATSTRARLPEWHGLPLITSYSCRSWA